MSEEMSEEVAQAATPPTSSVTLKEGPSDPSPPLSDDSSTHKDRSRLSKDKITLKLILASGKHAEFVFPLITSVGDVTEYVYNNWPEEWAEEKESITSHHILRLIYQGRFLHENVTFLALNLGPGKRTVMHLVPREKLPQLSPDDMEKSPKSTERSCCCVIL